MSLHLACLRIKKKKERNQLSHIVIVISTKAKFLSLDKNCAKMQDRVFLLVNKQFMENAWDLIEFGAYKQRGTQLFIVYLSVQSVLFHFVFCLWGIMLMLIHSIFRTVSTLFPQSKQLKQTCVVKGVGKWEKSFTTSIRTNQHTFPRLRKINTFKIRVPFSPGIAFQEYVMRKDLNK